MVGKRIKSAYASHFVASLELAKDGKSIPANVLQAYMPAIIILDNIAKGGAGFVQALRALENRAQNSRK